MARLVVVDDERDLTDVVAAMLQEDCHTVTACNTARDALACVIAEQPDLVLLDIRLDGEREAGWDILDQLRTNPLTAMIPVIVTSAALDDLRARKAWLQEHRIPVLPKPFDIDDLLGLVRSCTESADAAGPAH